MKIILTEKEVMSIRKVAYKFNIEDHINNALKKLGYYDYVSINENDDMEINVSEKMMNKVTGALSAMAPKIIQMVGMFKGVVALIEDLFSDKTMKEFSKFDLFLCPFTKINDKSRKTLLEIDEFGVVVECNEAELSFDDLNRTIERLKTELTDHPDLATSNIGYNIEATIKLLNLRDLDKKKRF